MSNHNLVLDTIQMDCPFCNAVHAVEKRLRLTQAIIKGETVSYNEVYYLCPLCADEEENEFAPAGVMDENLLNARNAYRLQNGLLTSEQIADIRKLYEMTQSDFSALFGWGEVTVTRYESKNIQDETYDKLMRMAGENPKFALDSLKAHRDRFTPEKYQTLKARIQARVDAVGVSFLKRQEVLAQYAAFEEPCEWNGFQLLNLEKLGAVMAYFADAFHYVYKVKLMKLLWYADALAFSKWGHSLSGLVYQHEQYGALPIGSRDFIYLPSVSVSEEEEEDRTKYRICNNGSDVGYLNAEEQSILGEVFERFKWMKTDEIVQCMHDEIAYRKTEMHDKISFSLCRDLNAFPNQ